MSEEKVNYASIFVGDSHQAMRMPTTYEWVWRYEQVPKDCGACKVRINSLPDKYGAVVCPNGHRNVQPK